MRGEQAVSESPQRYSARPFPPYRYIPGKSPHPVRDAGGHSRDRAPETLDRFDAESWRECDLYLYGIDLFNHGFWWEAHEALETCWHAAGRNTPTGLFVQGLIQVAAACLKRHQGFHDAAGRLAREGLEKIPRDRTCCLGIHLEQFRRAVLDALVDPSRTLRIHLEFDDA